MKFFKIQDFDFICLHNDNPAIPVTDADMLSVYSGNIGQPYLICGYSSQDPQIGQMDQLDLAHTVTHAQGQTMHSYILGLTSTLDNLQLKHAQKIRNLSLVRQPSDKSEKL